MSTIPTTGAAEMFGIYMGFAPPSIYEAVKNKYGEPASEDFAAIITKCIEVGDINDFHPAYRPATLGDLNEFTHFLGFPMPVSVQVDYFYSEDLMFLKTNSVQTSIEGFDYGEANTPNINIGTDGTTIITSYEISATDAGELTGSEEIGITLTIKKNNSGGTEIYSGTASSSSASIIPVGRTLTPSDIGTANKIWVSVELAIVEP